MTLTATLPAVSCQKKDNTENPPRFFFKKIASLTAFSPKQKAKEDGSCYGFWTGLVAPEAASQGALPSISQSPPF